MTCAKFYAKVGPFSHLGDVIAMVQWVHRLQGGSPKSQFYIYSDAACGCGCGRNAASQIVEILDLLDTKVQIIPYRTDGNFFVPPVFFYVGQTLGYAKASRLPKEVYNYITTQLVPTGDFEWPSRKLTNIPALINSLNGEKIYNLGDSRVEGTAHFMGSVKEKLRLIAGAKMHITVDSGTAHLAAMTNTPVLVIAPEKYRNRYLGQGNVRFLATDLSSALPLISKIIQSRPRKMCRMF